MFSNKVEPEMNQKCRLEGNNKYSQWKISERIWKSSQLGWETLELMFLWKVNQIVEIETSQAAKILGPRKRNWLGEPANI